MGDCKSLQGWSNLFRRRISNPPERLTVFTHTPCFTLIEQALSVFLTLIMFNDPWVLPDEVCVIVFTFFHEGEYDP